MQWIRMEPTAGSGKSTMVRRDSHIFALAQVDVAMGGPVAPDMSAK